MHLQRLLIPALLLISSTTLNVCLTACVRTAPGNDAWQPSASSWSPAPSAVSMDGSTSTPSFRLPPTRIPGSPNQTPTPDAPHFAVAGQTGPQTYIVQAGDTLSGIAAAFGVSLDELMAANSLTDPDRLDVDQVLIIPANTPHAPGPAFKIIPDSELIYGPMSIIFNVEAFTRQQGGYLAGYAQNVDGDQLSGAQVVERVAQDYSVNPRLLLALLEYRSGWVTNANPDPAVLDTPLGVDDGWHDGLYLQLSWAANILNRGYYLWRAGGVQKWTLADDSVVPIDPTINAGTAGLQHFFSQQDDYLTWLADVSEDGFYAVYYRLIGYPFDLAIEPLIPADLVQPRMQLPFERGEVWAFTSGPHGGWGSGSAWAALDFAPWGMQGCETSDAWVVAVADGWIVRASNGAVVQDLDDGYEQTGWAVLYMHIEERDRVAAQVYLHAGERIGHPSCTGGEYTGTHVHLARKFNGEWIPADGPLPFNLDGWISSGNGVWADGFLTRGSTVIEAFDGSDPINQIQR